MNYSLEVPTNCVQAQQFQLEFTAAITKQIPSAFLHWICQQPTTCIKWRSLYRMPGVIIFRRRWSVGSDDFVVPGLFLFTIHLVWWVATSGRKVLRDWLSFCLSRIRIRLIILSIILLLFEYDKSIKCIELLWYLIVGYICLLSGECDVRCRHSEQVLIGFLAKKFVLCSFVDSRAWHLYHLDARVDSGDDREIIDAILVVHQIK